MGEHTGHIWKQNFVWGPPHGLQTWRPYCARCGQPLTPETWDAECPVALQAEASDVVVQHRNHGGA